MSGSAIPRARASRALRAFALAWMVGVVALLLGAPAASALAPRAWHSIAQSQTHTVAVKGDGSVWAWGSNGAGQLGDGTTTSTTSPVRVLRDDGTPLEHAISVSAGYTHSVATLRDGSVWSWGDNTYGQLGDGTTTFRNRAVRAVFASNGSAFTAAMKAVAGGHHTAVLRANGSLWAWGWNEEGRVGDGTTLNRAGAVAVVYESNGATLQSFKDVDAGWGHTAAVRGDGTVWTWGRNGYGRLGVGDIAPRNAGAVQATYAGGAPITNVKSLSASGTHTLALRSDGTVWAWGRNDHGELGIGTTGYRSAAVQSTNPDGTPVTLVTRVSTGHHGSVALRVNGLVYAWGRNAEGQVGDGTTIDRMTATLVRWEANGAQLPYVRGLGEGYTSAFAIRADNMVVGWGNNAGGVLGDGTTINRTGAVTVGFDPGLAWSQVDSEGNHTVALRSDGTVWTWGSNGSGQLGNGTLTSASSPVQARFADGTPLTLVTAISAGARHGMALRANGTAVAWGSNANGQLGDGTVVDTTGAVTVTYQPTGGTLTAIASVEGASMHSLAVQANGRALAWGHNLEGRLGDNTSADHHRADFVRHEGVSTILTDIVDISGSWGNSVAVRSDGSVWAWGRGSYGRNGDGTTAHRLGAVQSKFDTGAALTYATQVSVSSSHAVVRRANGSVWSWARNDYGNLGDGTTQDRWGAVAAQYATGTAISYVERVAAGYFHTLAVRFNSAVWATGWNVDGQLGDNTLVDRHGAVSSTYLSTGAALLGMVDVTAGENYSHSLRSDGTIWSFGSNVSTKLGDCTTIDRHAAVQRNCAPAAPASLQQFRANGTTAVASGEWTFDGATTNVVLRFTVTDADPAATVTPWVELAANGAAFAGTCGASGVGMHQGGSVAPASQGAATTLEVPVTGLVRGSTYRWRACAVDEHGGAGPWTERGATPDFGVSSAPSTPSLVSPAAGAAVTTLTPTLTATFQDPNAGQTGRVDLQLCSTSTCGTVLQSGSSASALGSGSNGSWSVPVSLTWSTTYWWRARNVDATGLASPWSATRSFVTDRAPAVAVLVDPADGSSMSDTTPTFTARFSDPDSGDTGRLLVQACPVADCSTVTQSGSSTAGVANGSTGTWTPATELPAGTWFWRARGEDQHGILGPWSSTWRLTVGASSMTLQLDAASVAMSSAPLVSGVDAAAGSTITITTDSAYGYALTATDQSDTWAAATAGATATITDWTGTATTPTQWPAGTSGYMGVTVLDASGGRLAKWGAGSGTMTSFATNRYAGLTTSAGELHRRTSFSTAPDTLSVAYRVNVGPAQRAGTYSATIAYTVVPNP